MHVVNYESVLSFDVYCSVNVETLKVKCQRQMRRHQLLGLSLLLHITYI